MNACLVLLNSPTIPMEGNRRKRDALQLASEHNIGLATAYQIVDAKFTLEEALRRKEASDFHNQKAKCDVHS